MVNPLAAKSAVTHPITIVESASGVGTERLFLRVPKGSFEVPQEVPCVPFRTLVVFRIPLAFFLRDS